MPSSDPPPTPNRKRKLSQFAKLAKRARVAGSHRAAQFTGWLRTKGMPRALQITRGSGRNLLSLGKRSAQWSREKGARVVQLAKSARKKPKPRPGPAPQAVAGGVEESESASAVPPAVPQAAEEIPEIVPHATEVPGEEPQLAEEPLMEVPGEEEPAAVQLAMDMPEEALPAAVAPAMEVPGAVEPAPLMHEETSSPPAIMPAPPPRKGAVRRFFQFAKTARSGGIRRCLPPIALLLLAGFIGLTLLGKMRREVWTYYSDDQGTRAEVQEEKTRYVLWEDPRPHNFEETRDAKKPAADPVNQPAGRLEAAFSPDGTMMILVRWEAPESNADLFSSRWNGRVWSRPEPIASINSKSNERGPAFSRDSRYLYFSSDRSGGDGGYDLYVARWNGKQWDGIESLGPTVNSSEDEAGPALSADDSRLFFSSNREGARADDIFVAQRISLESNEEPREEPTKDPGKTPKKKPRNKPKAAEKEPSLPPVPRFQLAEAATHLNSSAHDVQAALTSRGNHVFLASDRDRRGRKGYGVYFSRVVDGVSLKPEKVDLYIEKGDVTDPAVRMDGFDLLFSADHEADTTEDGANFRLYHTTTREVIGYTDLSRWEQFKELIGNVAWWLFLGVAALIALIYLLESWRDISSLFHKCLAGSAAAHLLLLLFMAALVIAKELEKQAELPPSEILVSVDALTEEELALESVPDETEITQPDLSLPAEKAATNFDIPDFQPEENEQAIPIDAQFQQDAVDVEVQAAQANPTEDHPTQPAEASALLSELSETVLAEPDQPVLDEREFAEAPEPAKPAEDEFKPTESLPATERVESPAVVDTAVETPPEVAEVEPSESIADHPAPMPLTAVNPTQADHAEAPHTLESQLLAELPESAPVETERPELDEGEPNAAEAPANPADDQFNPANSVPALATNQAQGETVDDSAAQSQTDATEVASGDMAATPLANGPAAPVGEAHTTSNLPEPSPNSGPLQDLPESALVDPGAPKLDEGNPNDAPANPADVMFKPNGAMTEATTSPLEGTPVSDAAVPNQADAAEVASGEVAPTPATPGPSPAVGEAQAEESVPEADLADGLPGGLPVTALLDPGAPRLEEGDQQPANAPADPGKDMFKPGSATSQPVASKLGSGPSSDSALNNQTGATEVAQGELASTPANQGAASAVGEANSEQALPGPSTLANNLPASSLLDPGAPTLDEGSKQGAPADSSKDMFKPGSASQPVASKLGSGPSSDSALNNQTGATEVAQGELASTPANQGAASAVGEANSEQALPGPSTLANNLPASSLLDPGAPTLDEGSKQGAPADSSKDMFKPGSASQPVASKLGSGPSSDSALNNQTGATEVAQGELASTPANQGAASAVGEANSEQALPGPSTLANNLPASSLLDPGAPTLDEGSKQGAPADSSKDMFKPGGAQTASTKAAGSTSGDEATADSSAAGSVAGGGLVAQASNLTGPQTGLEAGTSETPTTAGTLGPVSLDSSLTGSLLPGELEAPEKSAGAMTDFLKKQRGRPTMSVIKQLGGSDGTEMAIRASIKWLAENQEESGHWNSRKHGAKGEFDTGITGLALLCFYGWGARHDEDGDYRENVSRAITWLLSQQEDDGYLGGRGLMYCHAIASIALCEAYGITKDPKLREPAERAIAYTLKAQSKTKGGWRYRPGNDSDTSITGWQYMALHSARLAGIKVPKENFERVREWLDRAGGGKHGGVYGYQAPARNSPAMVATGMFCRQLDLVPPSAPMQVESAGILKMHPIRPHKFDSYYLYYGTLALYQHQGPLWETWNEHLKETVPLLQKKTGSKTGSWDASYGLAGNGGRVASTALTTLSLEVYYRILPIYGFRGDEDETPEVKEKGEEEE